MCVCVCEVLGAELRPAGRTTHHLGALCQRGVGSVRQVRRVHGAGAHDFVFVIQQPHVHGGGAGVRACARGEGGRGRR